MNTPRYKAEGSLRVWNVINVPNPATYYPVTDADHAVREINTLALVQLGDAEIESNTFGLEVFENGEWVEWYSEDGEGIDEYAERIENA